MRHFFTTHIPAFSRVLLVESGSRSLIENLLTKWRGCMPPMQTDLVTCYAGLPENLAPSDGKVYRVSDFPDNPARQRLYSELAANRYDVIGIICSAEPIMTKWKWMLAARVPAKVLIINENGDYFFLDCGHLSITFHFMLFRAGLTGALAVRTIARLVLFPFTLLYLILYAATVHLRRKIRTL
jgi:hypothetical protein